MQPSDFGSAIDVEIEEALDAVSHFHPQSWELNQLSYDGSSASYL
jgi:hypothetical protein